MRAAVVSAPGAFWTVDDVPAPRPAPDEVLIRVEASGLCYTDVHFTSGGLPHRFPAILGHEVAGVVIDTGSVVRTRSIGDRVGVPWLQRWCGRCVACASDRPFYCSNQIGTGVDVDGGHAELMTAPESATVILPDALSFEQAAPLFCAGYTVWSGLRAARPRPCERVAIVGVGGLGHLAIQYASRVGHEVVAISSSADKHPAARQMGASFVFESGEDLARAGGADVILATGNSYAAVAEAMRGLRAEGRLILMGAAKDTITITSDLMSKGQQIIGSGHNGPDLLQEALDLAVRLGIEVRAETYPLRNAPLAFQRVSAGKVRFRAVLIPTARS
jgi:D-arabinose 1-dehydrogenase-like Zn-dependent alcohol dehydrogenase